MLQNKNQQLRFELEQKNQFVRNLNDNINKKDIEIKKLRIELDEKNQCTREKDNEIKKLSHKIKELNHIIICKKNKVEEFKNWYLTNMIQEYSKYFSNFSY